MNTPTFRFVRQVITSHRTRSGFAEWTSHHSEFVADQAGDWIEKDYGNGSRSYRMALDCNQAAVAKMRAGA